MHSGRVAMIVQDAQRDDGDVRLLTAVAAGRDREAELRDDFARGRDRAAMARDLASTARKSAGHLRDRAGRLRDEAAATRDRTAERLDCSEPSSSDARVRAATDRRLAALDRGAARRDRAAANRDRKLDAQDSVAAKDDRITDAVGRIESATDRRSAARSRQSNDIELSHAALDELTQSYLRGPGLAELDRAIAKTRTSRQPLSVAFADIDHLKAINDRDGHAAGDLLIQQVVTRLRAAVRSSDLIVRLGGDEFICVFRGLTLAQAAARLTGEPTGSDVAHAQVGRGSFTVGLAELSDTDTVDTLIARADRALYRARTVQAREHS